ncbi:MAG: glycerol-3-phosphate acyltransferase, partial [Armatimonadota bacterium]
MTAALCLAASYLLGAIPFGLIVGKLTRGIDIRQFGSGNIGASNVLRTLGPGPALLVFALDTAKGLAAVEICRRFGLSEWWIVAGGLLSVFGHTFSVFLAFKGGKGVATALGVVIGLCPVIAAVGF